MACITSNVIDQKQRNCTSLSHGLENWHRGFDCLLRQVKQTPWILGVFLADLGYGFVVVMSRSILFSPIICACLHVVVLNVLSLETLLLETCVLLHGKRRQLLFTFCSLLFRALCSFFFRLLWSFSSTFCSLFFRLLWSFSSTLVNRNVAGYVCRVP